MASCQDLTLCVLVLFTYQSMATKTIDGNSLLRKLERARQDLPGDNQGNNVAEKEENKAIMVCGNREVGHNGRRKRYLTSKFQDGTVNKWENTRLTWAIVQPSRQIDLHKQRRIIRESLQVWSQVSPLVFMMVDANSKPDISFKFARKRHGPPFDPVFDGRESTNAANIYGHAWGPGRIREGIAGDVHIDDDDDWSEEHKLKGVVVHELGHSMGLSHSDDPEAIMFAIYRDTTELGNDDIQGIQFLYGSIERPITSRPRPKTTPRPRIRRPVVTYQPHGPDTPYHTVTPKPEPVTFAPDSPCVAKDINAVVEDPFSDESGLYYAFVKDRLHHIMFDGTHLSSVPLKEIFPGVPENPDVVFTEAKRKSIFYIKDQKIWELKVSGPTPESPRSISFPETPSYAISLFDVEGNKRLYLFGKNYWWSFQVDQLRSYQHYEIRKFSRDIPANARFATTWHDKKLYVIARDSYVILDTTRRYMTHDKPIQGKPNWLHPLCRSGSSRLILQPWIVACLFVLVKWISKR